MKAALKDPEFIKREEALGAVIVTDARLNGAEHKKFVESEIAKWRPDHQGRRPVRRLSAASARLRLESRLAGAACGDFAHVRRCSSVIGIVTGPSLTRCTCMSAPNSPQATCGCSARADATTRS